MADRQRYWFIDKDRLALVEKVTNAITVDSVTSNYQPISVSSKSIRIYATVTGDDLTITDSTNNTYTDIPPRFHESIVSKVIADGYKDPRNFDAEKSMFFLNDFLDGVKRGKKFKRSNYTRTGAIAPQEF